MTTDHAIILMSVHTHGLIFAICQYYLCTTESMHEYGPFEV